MTFMQHKRFFLRLLILLAVIFIAATIFLLSNQPAPQSGHLSTSLASYTHSLYQQITHTEITLKAWDHKLRKLAHACIFFILSSLIMLLCYTFKFSYKKSATITLFFSIVFAMTDEFHQLFVNGRGASIVDIGIDSIGIFLAVVIMSVIFRRSKK